MEEDKRKAGSSRHLGLGLPSVSASHLFQGACLGLGHSLLPTGSISVGTPGCNQIKELAQLAPTLISFLVGQRH